VEKLRRTKNAPAEIKNENHAIIFYDLDGIIHKEFVPQRLLMKIITWAL